MPRGRMQRIPFTESWAITQEPGLPVPVDEDNDDDVIFEEPPASPDPSLTATSVYEITASNFVSESSSVPTSGLPTPPTVNPPIPIAALIQAAAQRLQEAAPDIAPEAAPDAAPEAAQDAAQEATPDVAQEAAPDAAQEARDVAHRPPPLRRSSRIAERDRRAEAEAAVTNARACPHRNPQRVAKMSTGGIRKA